MLNRLSIVKPSFYILVVMMVIGFSAESQLVKSISKDSLNGKPKQELYVTAWIKFNGFIDAQGIPNESAMHLPSIPTEIDSIAADPQFHADLYQTRIILASAFQTKSLGEITSYIETDFFGDGGGGLRLRHAYVRFLNFRIGQTWSGFTDEEAWPNITDFDGPATGAWIRSAQIAYFVRPNTNQDILFSIEAPVSDYSRYLFIDSLITPALQGIPDLVSHYEFRWPRGHFQLGAVGRLLEYKDANESSQYLLGGGFSLSGSSLFFKQDKLIYQQDKLIYQVAAGTGIARYLVSFGGGGWDAIPNLQGSLETVPVYGGYLGYQHFWTRDKGKDKAENLFSSTIVYGYVYLKNPIENPKPSLLTGSYASANLYWHVVGPLNFAVEGIYGYRTDERESSGDDFRFQFVMEYRF